MKQPFTDERGYATAMTYERDGGLGIEIRLRLGRDFTETDRSNLLDIQDKLKDLLERETVRLDPKEAEMARVEKNSILSCFGPHVFYVDEIPNGYCNQACCSMKPWFIVTTSIGRFKIGWRKRVIHLEWTETQVQYKASDLFTDDVTKEARMIHAYGYDKAKEYIDRIFKQVGE